MAIISLEYSLFDLLKNKLDLFLDEPSMKLVDIKENYSIEAHNICSKLSAARKLEFYTQTANKAFEFADKFPTNRSIILDQFMNFI